MIGSVGPRVGFLIVNWNTRELVLSLLETLRNLPADWGAECIVVDNASADGSAGAIRELHPGVRLVENDRNLGFARGVNQAIAVSVAPILCLLNPDVLIGAREVEHCLVAIEARPEIGALGPLLLDGDGAVWQFPDRFPTPGQLVLRALFPFLARRRISDGRPLGQDLRAVDWLPGACLFLRRSVLERVGRLDERFFLYNEDVDLCLRLRHAGFQTVRHGGARGQHLIAQSTRRNPEREPNRANVEAVRSDLRLAQKHWRRSSVRFVALGLRLALDLRAAKAGWLWRLRHRETDRRKLSWLGEARHLTDRRKLFWSDEAHGSADHGGAGGAEEMRDAA